MPNPLDPTSLLALLLTLLPTSSSSPLQRPTDDVAALVHAIHTALDFRLIPIPQSGSSNPDSAAEQASAPASHQDRNKNTVETETDIDDTASETPTAVDQEEESVNQSAHVEGRLSPSWNARGEEAYTFEYRHAQSAMVFRIRVGRMGGRIQIDGMAEDGEPHTLSIPVTDLLDPAAFPIPGSATRSNTAGAGGSSSNANDDAAAKSLGFKTVACVRDFVERYNREIIAKLLPGLQKDGYSAPTSSGSDPRAPPPAQPARNDPPAQPSPLYDPLHPARNSPHPASIGHRDLDPLASLRPSAPGTFNPQSDGGGMYMDFNHPLFDGRRRGLDPDLEGPGGSIQPPGARWDPVGPGMGGGPRFPGPGGNPLGGVGRGDREWGDELPPPGEFGPDLGGMGGLGGSRRGGGGRGGGLGGLGGGGGGFGGGLGGGGRFGGGGGGGFRGGGFGGGMYM